MLETIFQKPTQQVLTKYNPQLKQINAIGTKFKNFTDLELQAKTSELKERFASGQNQEAIINEAFALVREASDRVLGLRHYDVQIIGGLVLNEGKIAEMKTGEGKTLVALLPTFYNALSGKGTHVVTVNDYLAKRDAEYAGQVHRFLGLSVGLIQDTMESEESKKIINVILFMSQIMSLGLIIYEITWQIVSKKLFNVIFIIVLLMKLIQS